MVSGTTKTGFNFTVDEKIANDWRLTKAIARSQAASNTEKIQGAVDIVKLVLGEQEEALCEHIASTEGAIPTERVMEEMKDILDQISEKNKEIKN